MLPKIFHQENFFYRKFTLVEGMYKYELFKFLKKIDPYSELQINDIPENLIADTIMLLLIAQKGF